MKIALKDKVVFKRKIKNWRKGKIKIFLVYFLLDVCRFPQYEDFCMQLNNFNIVLLGSKFISEK